MALLNASLRRQLHDLFVALPNPVTLLVFVTADDGGRLCETCNEARDLADELASASDGKLLVELYDLAVHPGEAALYGIDKAPALVVLGGESGRRDFGIRFFGSPTGYEFATLIEDIRMASSAAVDLAESTVDLLSHLSSPLHLQVFVTPTCPYCPRAVLLAHQMAIASDWVTADAIDATEFPDLADRYHVRGVPRTVVNDSVFVEGAVPEAMLMAHLMPLLDTASPPAA